MALEAVVFPQIPFSNYMSNNDWSYDGLVRFGHDDRDHSLVNSINMLENQGDDNDHHYHEENRIASTSSMVPPNVEELNFSAEEVGQHFETSSSVRGKRRKKRSEKNKEDIHNQRMTHIAVERNRRKQMNDYLSLLRSIMPHSYVQKGDQASIIGGAINFVKELEQKAQLLGVGKLENKIDKADEQAVPFSEFFAFPQYSTGECHAAVADVEVMMVERHVSIKIRSKRWPKQLLKLLSGLHAMSLTVLHLNVTTQGQIVLYSLNVKVEEDCTLSLVDEIATGVYQILVKVQEEELIS